VQVIEQVEHHVNEAHMIHSFLKVKDEGVKGWGWREFNYHHKLIHEPRF
jgi:hypothetical protein